MLRQVQNVTNALCPTLHRALTRLKPSGAKGFEGLVRALLAEVSGQGFRLMKAGPQGGVDILGDLSGSAVVVGLEAKHYGLQTRLPLDALKSKLRDAAQTFPAMDLWALAATRPISAGDVAQLEDTAAELGLDVLVLDWDPASPTPPPLAVLCAAAPNAVDALLGRGKALTDELVAIRAHPAFAAERARLHARLTSPLVGYGAARAQCAAWIRRSLLDDAAARLAFDSYAALEAPDARRVARPTLSDALGAWLASSSVGIVAVLGEEGVGKTWGVLAWWLEGQASDPDFPLTLVIPARRVAGADGRTLLAEQLHRVTGLRDPGFWRRRLERWARLGAERPPILVMIDGLNENWLFRDWSMLVLDLTAAEWTGACSVAVTSRPDYWRHRLMGLQDLPTPPVEHSLGPFTDPELDSVLDLHGLKRGDFPAGLLGVLRVPRLCRIAITRRHELSDSGDVTLERLVYEDWRHRAPQARQTLSHQEFQAFVSSLGLQLRATLGDGVLTRAQLLERLAADSGRPPQDFEGVLSELIDGRWLRPAGRPHQFQVDPTHTPYALGLALLDEVGTMTDRDEAMSATIASIEPLRGLDIGVAILRSAATFALLDAEATRSSREALLLAWLGQQNFRASDFEAFWRLIGLDPVAVLNVAETLWFDRRSHGQQDEVLVKGFSNAWRWSEVSEAAEARLTTWFSRYWQDRLEGEVLGTVADDDEAAARRAQTRARATTWATEVPALTPALEFEICEHAPDKQAWGSYRAVELMSWLPRAPLVRPLTAWAVSAALLGGFRQFDKMAWVLRWNVQDPVETEAAILARADLLLNAGGAIAREAGLILLRALGSPAARARHDAADPPQDAKPTPRPPWNAQEVMQWGRCRDRPLEAVCALKADPRDPDLDLPPEELLALRALASQVTTAQLRADPGTSADGGFLTGRLALSRWAPDLRADLERRRFADVPAEFHRLAQRLPEALLVMPDASLTSWRAAVIKPGAPADAALTFALPGCDAATQIALFGPGAPELPQHWPALYAPPKASDFAALAERLPSDGNAHALHFWLGYLQAADTAAMPDAWPPVVALFTHADDEVRGQALHAAYRACQPAMASALAATGWSWHEKLSREEAAFGSLLLARAPEAAEQDMSGRVHPQALGDLAERHPRYVAAFADYVRDELEALLADGPHIFPRNLLTHTGGWDRLVAERGADVLAWLEPHLDPDARETRHAFFMDDSFPLLEALKAVEPLDPGLRAAFVASGLKASKGGAMRMGILYAEGCRIPGETAEAARRLVLEEANDDEKLFDMAFELQKSGQADWLLGQIASDLAAVTAADIARGLVLAGFLDQTPAADALWATRLAGPPCSGWLAEVHAAARMRYQTHRWTLHWAARFRDAASDDEAFAAHELMVAACDPRVFLDGVRPQGEAIAGWSWRRRTHWRVGWPAVRAAAKARKDEYKKVFLATDLPLSKQRPRQH